MNFIRRALLYCRRQKLRSLLLFLTITCLAAFVLTGIAIQKATIDNAENLRTEVGGIVRLEADVENGPRTTQEGENGAIHSYVGDFVAEKLVNAIKKIEGVVGINAQNEQGFWGSGINFDYIPGQFSMGEMPVPNTAVLNSENSDPFQSGKFTLEEGRHITEEDKHVIILSEEVAKRNQLKVGDKIQLYNMDIDGEVTLELIGIYSGAGGTGGDAMIASQIPENAGFVDFTTMRENFGREIEGYPSIDILVNDPARIEAVRDEVENLPEMKGKTLKTRIINEEYEAISNPLESIQKSVGMVVTAIAAVGIAILGLLLFLWTKNRKQEVGILLAVGKSKADIIGQLLAENFVVAALAFTASYFLTGLIADKVCAILAGRTGVDADTINVGVTIGQTVSVCGIGFLVVGLCVAIASYTVIRLKPKDILTKID